jgi:hypothetical protein
VDETFKAKVSVEISHLSAIPDGIEFDGYGVEALVFYRARAEMREWGLKGISFSAPDQEFEFLAEALIDGAEDSSPVLCKVKLSGCEVDASSVRLESDISPQVLIIKIQAAQRKAGARGLELECQATGELVF